MKLSFFLVIGVLFLSACSATKQNTLNDYIDLINDKEAVLNYWIVHTKVAPKYPQQAKTKVLSGCVEFSLIIGSDGKALNPTIVKTFPKGVFDAQATRAIKKWKWAPTVTNPNRQAVATTIQYDFVVKESPNWQEAYDRCKV